MMGDDDFAAAVQGDTPRPGHFKRCPWIFLFSCFGLSAIAACSFSIMEIDRPLAEFLRRTVKPEWVAGAQNLIALSIPSLFVFVLALVHDHVVTGETNRTRNRFLVLVAAAAVAILLVEISKMIFVRISSTEYLATGAYGFHYFDRINGMGLSPFPSEYGAIAGATTGSLWLIARPYRPTIILLALILSGSQVIAGTHFLSDIISGFAIGLCAFLAIRKLFSVCGVAAAELE
jgi:membrane-associated phospholipid phosphatase